MTNLLTTKEAATLLGVSPRRVVALIREGRLPAVKMGRDWAIKKSAIEKFKRLQPWGAKGEGR